MYFDVTETEQKVGLCHWFCNYRKCFLLHLKWCKQHVEPCRLRQLHIFSKHLIKENDKNELAVFKNDNLETTKYQKQVEFYEKQMKSLHTYYQEY